MNKSGILVAQIQRTLALIIFVVITMVATQPVEAQQSKSDDQHAAENQSTPEIQIDVSETFNGPSTDIVVETRNSANGFANVWLRGSVKVPEVKLIVELNGANVTLLLDGTTPTEPVALTHPRLLSINVSDVTEPGTYRGSIVALIGDSLITVAKLTVVRQGELAITGVGIANTEITASTKLSHFVRPYTVTSTYDKKVNVAITIDQLVGPDGKLAATRIKDHRGREIPVQASRTVMVEVPAFGSIGFSVKADLPVSGVYVSNIKLATSMGKTEIDRPFKLTRSESEVALFNVQSLSHTAVDDLRIGDSTSVSLNMVITENNLDDIQISEIELLSLDRVDGKSRVAAEYDPLPDHSAAIRIPRNQTKVVAFPITGINRPGLYEGKVRVTAGNSTPVDTTFTLFVRRQGWIAFATIAFGVLVAITMRWVARRRDSYAVLDRLRKIERRLTKLEKNLKKDVVQITTRFNNISYSMRRKIVHIEAKVSRIPAQELEADLTVLERKTDITLPHWLVLLQEAVMKGVLDDLSTQFQTIEQYLHAQAPDQSLTKAAESALQEVQNELSKTNLVDLSKQIQDQRAAMERYREALGDDVVDPLLESLEEADNSISTNATDARKGLATVRLNWVKAFVQRTFKEIPEAEKQPAGYPDDQTWKNQRQEVIKLLEAARDVENPDEALESFNTALIRLIDYLSTALQQAVDDKETLLRKPKDSTKLQRIDEVNSRLAEVRGYVGTGDGEAARSAYQRAVTAYEKMGNGVRMNSAIMLGQVPTLIPNLPTNQASIDFGVRVASLLTALEVDQEGVKLLAKLWAKMQDPSTRHTASSLAWTVLSIAVVGLLGLQVVYLNNASWGDLNDIIIAFVWGLGLHTGATAVQGAAINRFGNLPGA